MALQHLRSSTANKRPTPAGMSAGQLAMNTNVDSPGLFLKDSNGDLVKVGPIHVGTTAPNVTPAAGGQAGNSKGEQWLDTSSSRYVFKIWDGTAWRTEDGEFVNASGDTMTGALVMDNQAQVRFRETTANGTNFIALQAPASVTADRTLTLPDVTGTIVSTGDTGTVTSTMILDGTLVDADINASAAIALSKLATGALPSGITVASTNIVDGTIVDADINASAAIAFSKLATGALPSGITVASANIVDGTIVNADINASAAIVDTKLATIATAGKVSNSATTATDANTASAIVARSASGNFNATSINNGPLAGFRNAIINGNFDIWQRGISAAAFDYATADRWTVRSAIGTGGSLTQSRQPFALGQTDVPGEPTYFWRLVYTGTTGTPFAEQQIEGVRTFAGQVVTVSFWAKRSASSSTCNVTLVQSFGTGGSPSAAVLTSSSNFTIGTNWTYITATLTLPSIADTTLGSNGDDKLQLRLNAGGTGSFTIEFAQVQLEPGPVATPFERRPIGVELALCQRYFLKLGSDDDESMIGVARKSVGGDLTYRGTIFTPVTMRAVPSYSGADINAFGNGTIVVSSIFPNSIHGSGVFFYGSNVAGVGNEAYILRYSLGESGAFSAEL